MRRWLLGVSLCSLCSLLVEGALQDKLLPFTEDGAGLFSMPARTASILPTAASEAPRDIITREDLLIVIPTTLSRCDAIQTRPFCTPLCQRPGLHTYV